MKHFAFTAFTLVVMALASCDKDRGFNLFTVEQDVAFGDSLTLAINNNTDEYPVLPRNITNARVYAYFDAMKEEILQSEKFKYADVFDWEVTIIDADVKNAFAAPGGKLYFYTGLITYLDDAASLAGVMGHEMAHADLRHSTQVMTKAYGLDFLLGILTGQEQSDMETVLSQLASGAAQLKFSRDNEYDADRYSMYYLASTKYEPLGITSFFEKMIEEGETEATFTWLSTHPSDQDRINAAKKVYANDSYLTSKMKGKEYISDEDEFQDIKELLIK
ncbi:MAG: M48 family metalloprotease [Breznakibacter sp.]